MLIDIEKIVVKDRIRKDYGNLKELAEDIKKNGLINPPAISRTYQLIAGERRLKACRDILGWKQIEVHQMDVDDAEKQLYMEISENESRKEFTMMERLDYARQIARVEGAKAKERQEATRFGATDTQNSAEPSDKGETRDKVASAVDMSHDTLRKAQYIADHKNDIPADDFTDWDEGKLSTNKVFQNLKRKFEESEEKYHKVSETRDKLVLEKRELEKKLADSEEPKVIEKKVIPSDYNTLIQERQEYLDKLRDAESRIKELEDRDGEAKQQDKLEKEAEYFTAHINDFIQKMGGYVWIADQADSLPDDIRKKFTQAVINIDGWAQAMIKNLGGNLNG